MDIHIELQDTDAKFSLFASSTYELTFGGLSVHMNSDQFQQLCDNLRPWVVDDTTTPQPSADAVREDSARLDWIESQIREYGDGYTEPREAGWGIQWQQERPDHYWPGLRAWIDEECRRASGDELESLLSAASGEKGVGK